MHVRSFLVAALTAGLVVACEDEPTRPPPTRFSTTASTASVNLTQDDTARFSVTVRNETSGQTIDVTGSFAQSLNPSIATVTPTSTAGTFRILGRRPGTARIIAGFAGSEVGAQDTVVVTVAARPVATLTVAPETGQTWADSTFRFTPTLRDAAGATITRRTARFRLLAIPTRIRRNAAGDSVGVDTLATVSAGDTVNATADGGLNEVAGGVVTARVTDTIPSITVRVIAEREGKADTSTLTIVRRPVETIEVTPNPASVAVGDTIQLTATVRAANGTVLTGRTVTWSSSNEALATVDQTGKVAGKAPTTLGTAVVIRATAEGKSGTAEVHVTP
jgi:trimeric autotransporter adhesin